ncbi:acylphosphatase [Histidinibacterium lentulum]|uniref:acylphosphatase n=1 Tax=Histidinibacterium lentulum TaxID=2480588 RepID=A0A3N2R598_9RHOB|nr:acylphosphatase [Histidinibacterium lentulum]ROU02659.1 acylphosphatase [Histidinibacterium lentulum]
MDIRVTGRVQGVGFRAWTVQTARRLGVAGWVRNHADMSVLAHAEGSETDVDAFVGALREGPAAAKVDRVAAVPCEATGCEGFAIRP